MQKLIDKLVLFGLCLLALSFSEIGWFSVVTMLGALVVTSLCSYFDNTLPIYLCAGYAVLCLLIPDFIVFLPLIVYDCSGLPKWPLRFCWVIALPACFFIRIPQLPIAVVLASGAAFLLQHRTAAQIKATDDVFTQMDNAKEQTEHLERINRDLMEKQDYEVRLATLAERNRIAREIHDNVGHLLTRSILQIGALQVRQDSTRDPGATPLVDPAYETAGGLAYELNMLKSSLSDAMDSIRSSVHDLHDESVDLKSRLEAMVDGFEFCPVKLRFDSGELPAAVKYCFIAIVREALSNIARHSGATEAAVYVTEHPAFCQLLISDNGTLNTDTGSDGIGLQNMADRVETLGGIFRIEKRKGFRIFITIPKEMKVEKDIENNHN